MMSKLSTKLQGVITNILEKPATPTVVQTTINNILSLCPLDKSRACSQLTHHFDLDRISG